MSLPQRIQPEVHHPAFWLGAGSLMDLSGYVTAHRLYAAVGPLPPEVVARWVRRTRRFAWGVVALYLLAAAWLVALNRPVGWLFAAVPAVVHAVLWVLTRDERAAGRRLVHG